MLYRISYDYIGQFKEIYSDISGYFINHSIIKQNKATQTPASKFCEQ